MEDKTKIHAAGRSELSAELGDYLELPEAIGQLSDVIENSLITIRLLNKLREVSWQMMNEPMTI